MSNVHTSATTAIGVNDGSSPPSPEDRANVSALAFTPVGKVEDAGEFGGEANIQDFTPLDTGIVEKVSGSINRGDMQLSIGASKNDPGHAILEAAFESRQPIYVEVDMPDGTGGREVDYLKAIVSSYRKAVGTADDIIKINVNLAISAVY